MVSDQGFEPLEKNGFTPIDVTPAKIKYQMYAWRPPQALEEIDSLKPFYLHEISREGSGAVG